MKSSNLTKAEFVFPKVQEIVEKYNPRHDESPTTINLNMMPHISEALKFSRTIISSLALVRALKYRHQHLIYISGIEKDDQRKQDLYHEALDIQRLLGALKIEIKEPIKTPQS